MAMEDPTKDDPTPTVIKYTLIITKPTGGKLVSKPGNIDCGGEGTVCEAKFDKGTQVTLTAKADTGYAPGDWQGACDKTATGQPCKLAMDADMAAGLTFVNLNDIDGDGIPNDIDPDDDNDMVLDTDDVDDDGDGLIEIENLDMFNNIRHNLAGTSYKTGTDAEDNRMGAPKAATKNCTRPTMDGGKSLYLCGYELTGNLDFDQDSSYAAGSANKSLWQPNNSDPDSATNEGFVGIDSGFGIEENIPSIFEGNGYTISNFYSRNTDDSSPGDGADGNPRARVGLFKSIEANATIRNLGVVNARLYGSASDEEQIGSLVSKNKGKILACYATGAVNGGAGIDTIGGLVGTNTAGTKTAAGTIIDSHATVTVNSGANADDVGGLVGRNNGSIIASYATGTVNGGAGNYDDVGGLVGGNNGSILASYATGAVNGSAEHADYVGGLVGYNYDNATIVASYATGAVNGGTGDRDYVGGLVGYNYDNATIVASYATGTVNGDAGDDRVGVLVAKNRGGSTITVSYGFGSASNGENKNFKFDTEHPTGLTGSDAARANGLTAPGGGNTSVDAKWDNAASKTKDAWDFGTNSQPPALRYADYDGAGSVDYCALFPDKIPGTETNLECGVSLLPGQR